MKQSERIGRTLRDALDWNALAIDEQVEAVIDAVERDNARFGASANATIRPPLNDNHAEEA